MNDNETVTGKKGRGRPPKTSETSSVRVNIDSPNPFGWLKQDRIDLLRAPDAVRIRDCLESLGYICTLRQAYELWLDYSVRHNEDDPANPLNNWFPLPETFTDIVSKLKNNIIPEAIAHIAQAKD